MQHCLVPPLVRHSSTCKRQHCLVPPLVRHSSTARDSTARPASCTIPHVCRPCTPTDSWKELAQSSQAPRPQDMPTGRGTMCTQQFLLLGGVVIHHQRPPYTSHMAFFSCMQGQLPTQCPQVLTDRCQVAKVYFDLLCERCSGPPHTM